MKNRKTFILLSAHSSPGQFSALFKKKNAWFYIGTDFQILLRWKTAFEAIGTYVSLSKEIEEYGLKLRREYLDYIAGMSEENNSLAWWATKIADKDPNGSDFYLYICMLSYFKNKMDALDDGSVIVSENIFFLDSFASLATSLGIRCINKYGVRKIAAYMEFYYRLGGRAVKFLLLSAYRQWTAQSTGGRIHNKGNKPACLIRTFVKDECFSDDGSFKDVYFGPLADWLQKKGHAVCIIPENMRLSRSFRSAVEFYRKSAQYRFLLAEDFLGMGDYIRCLAQGIKGMFGMRLNPMFRGMNISSLLTGDRLKYGLHGMKMIRYYYLCRRLRDAGIHPGHVILTFENKFMDKPFIMGVKHYLPDTAAIGYQHCAHYPLVLSFFTTEKEAGYAPLPDRIVTSGDEFCRILEEEGFPKKIIVSGPSLRFGYLFDERKGEQDCSPGRKIVLIVLPPYMKAALEMSLSVRTALHRAEDMDVLFKVHPAQRSALTAMLDELNIPPHFKVTAEPVPALLARADVAVSMGSTAEFEIIGSGVPLIRLRREIGFTFSPWIDGYEETTPASELMGRICFFLDMPVQEKRKLRERGTRALGKYFAPASENLMRRFIAELPDERHSSAKSSPAL